MDNLLVSIIVEFAVVEADHDLGVIAIQSIVNRCVYL